MIARIQVIFMTPPPSFSVRTSRNSDSARSIKYKRYRCISRWKRNGKRSLRVSYRVNILSKEREREKRKERKFNIPFLHPCKSCRYPVSIFRVPILTIPRAWFTESLDFDDNEFPPPSTVPSLFLLLLLLCNHPPPIFLTESRLVTA